VKPNRQIFTVGQVNRYAKRLLEADALLAGIFIEGEISNFHAHSSGHLYFSLKDAAAALSAVMFASHTETLAFKPGNGMKVIVFGRLSLYEKTGQYQLYAEYLEPSGVGGLHLAFAQLCEKLQDEGLFDESRKRPIPVYPRCVAVITSPTGAAVQDIIKTARERNPAVKLVVAPALVQGENAAADIARALGEVNAWGGADVIILGRGGGSTEDLWAFNTEITARAVAASRIPVISAVGHETDFTATDFTADARAATPTAAAQMAVYPYKTARDALESRLVEMKSAVRSGIISRHTQTKAIMQDILRLTQTRLAHEGQSLAYRCALLEKVSPYAAFARGFALAANEKGEAVTHAKALKTGDALTLRWADGAVKAQVTGGVPHDL
jgi:exodeoxyribonuclease VII large subunit